jgi:thiosulfate/3-mercaptopyruvate sulfurtransferase
MPDINEPVKLLIEPAELADWRGDRPPVIVDTRSSAEYAEAHIPGAVNIHDVFTYLAASTPEGIAAMRDHFAEVFGQAGIDGSDTVVFYEDGMGTGFGQSCRGHFMLAYLGHEGSLVLHGGLRAWRAEGRPVTDIVPQIKPRKLELNDSGLGMIVGKDDVLNELGKDRVTLLDVRDVDEWIGESSSPYGKDFVPRKGRIPGAKWLEWYRMMKTSGGVSRMKSPAEVRAECQNIGLDFDKPIWLYCFKGARTSNTYVALKQAGFTNISTYFGSWNEWARDENLPIEEGLPRG